MTAISSLKLYATHPHPCSYLADREATTLFVDPKADIDAEAYAQLSEQGFRRSGHFIYRPHCARCSACVPARIPVAHFRPDRRQKRIARANSDLDVLMEPSIAGEEFYALYARYISERHADGDMYPPTREQYDSFLSREWGTRYCCFRKDEQLLAVAVIDQMPNGLSAVYTFYDPDFPKRSLGTNAVLWQVEMARALGLPHVYLGYWIRECPKMAYKTGFRPLELRLGERWISVA